MLITINENDIIRQTSAYDAIYDSIGAICPQDVLWHYLTAKRMGYSLECENNTVYYISENDENLSDDDWENAQSERYIAVRESVAEYSHTWQQEFSDTFLRYLYDHNAAEYIDNLQSADNECRTPLECPWTYENNLDLWFDEDSNEAGVHYARYLFSKEEIPLDDIISYRSTRGNKEVTLDTENDRVKIDESWYPITWAWKSAEIENDTINGPVVWRQAGKVYLSDNGYRQVGKVYLSDNDYFDIDLIWNQDHEAETPEDCVNDWDHPERIDVDGTPFYRTDIF